MLRAVASLLIILLLSTTSSAQPLPSEWAKWLATNELQVQKNEKGIVFWSAHRTEVCRFEPAGKPRSDCLNKVDALIGRITWNRNLLGGTIDALKQLPTDEGIALASTVVPIYQKSDAEAGRLISDLRLIGRLASTEEK